MAAHRYWRLRITSTHGGGGPAFAALELRESAGGANLSLTGNGTASASSVINNEDPATSSSGPPKAFDGSNGTAWYSRGDGSFPYWLAWDFGAGNEKDIVHFTAINSSETPVWNANAGAYEYSDDGTVWTQLAVYAGTAGSLASTITVYTPPATGNAFLYSPLLATHAYDADLDEWVPVDVPISPLAAFGAATARLTAPKPTLAFHPGGGMELTSPVPALAFFGAGRAELIAPSATLRAKARSSLGDYSFTGTAPSPTLSAYAGANAELVSPTPTLGITATVVNFGTASVDAPAPLLSASGTVAGTANASLVFGSNLGNYELIGYGGALCSVTLTGKPTVTATGKVGSVGSAALTLPLFELIASGTQHNFGSASLLSPAAKMGGQGQAWIISSAATLTAIGTAVVAATYEAYAVNLLHRADPAVDEVTHYTNFHFTHVIRYQNSYYGVNGTGLYLLEGTTDNNTPIQWAFKTAIDDFGRAEKKTLASAYFGGRFGPASTIQVQSGEKAANSYSHSTPRGATAQNHRQKFGKGVKERYHALAASGVGELELDSIEIEVHNTSRKV